MGTAQTSFVQDGYATVIFCIVAPILGFIFSYVYYQHTARIHLDPAVLNADENVGLKLNEDRNQKQAENIWNVYNLIYEGAHAFLFSEYQYIGVFVVVFSIILLVVLGVTTKWVDAVFTVIAFLVGCGTSVLAGFIGMKIGVFANARTAYVLLFIGLSIYIWGTGAASIYIFVSFLVFMPA